MKSPWIREMILALVMAALLGVIMLLTGPDQSLDLKFYYSGKYATEFFEKLSIINKEKYLLNEYLDLALITAYSAAVYFAVKNVLPGLQSRSWAFLPGAFDFAETLIIISILKWNYGTECLPWLGLVTALKWTTGLITASWLFVAAYRKSLGAKTKNPI